MKKTTTILFAFIILLFSCGKKDGLDDGNNGENSQGDKTIANYTYKVPDFDATLSNLVLDDNNNAYLYVKAGDYKLISIGIDGKLRWSKTIANGAYNNNGTGIMIVNDKIILAYKYNHLGCYSTADGSEIWDAQLNTNFNEMAYNNGVIYVAQSALSGNQSELTAFNLNSGSQKWTKVMTSHDESRISVNGGQICLSTHWDDNTTFKEGITMFQDNGSTVTKLWSHFENFDDNNPVWGRKAIFDGAGNVFYQTGASDSCYIFSFNKNSGNLNWKSLISPLYPPESTLLYGNGKIFCSFSDDDMSNKQSLAIINASSGAIIKKVSKIIRNSNDYQMLLTGASKILVFNVSAQESNIQLYSENGTLSKTINGDFYKGVLAYDIGDAKIDKKGNLVMLLNDKILSAKLDLTTIGTNYWNYLQGTSGNTNSLNN